MLENFYVSAIETPIYDHNNQLIKDYKAIRNADTNKLIAITKSSYKLVQNQQLIEQLLETLDKTDIAFNVVGKPHSFINEKRMRLVLQFPELKYKDDSNDGIVTTMHIHNSYDGSERIRILFGLIRLVCSNGSIIMDKGIMYNHKHTKFLDVINIKKLFDNYYNKTFPMIQERINILNEINSKDVIREYVDKAKEISKDMVSNINQTSIENLWNLYCYFTWYITHHTASGSHSKYFNKISKLFKL